MTLQRSGGDVYCDFFQAGDMDRAWSAAEKLTGPPDLLVLNAGACVDDDFINTHLSTLESTIALNVFSPMLLARLAIRNW